MPVQRHGSRGGKGAAASSTPASAFPFSTGKPQPQQANKPLTTEEEIEQILNAFVENPSMDKAVNEARVRSFIALRKVGLLSLLWLHGYLLYAASRRSDGSDGLEDWGRKYYHDSMSLRIYLAHPG
jgi:hypothetical protein